MSRLSTAAFLDPRWLLTAVIMFLINVACDGDARPAPTPGESPPAADAPASLPTGGCEPRASAKGSPPRDPRGPYYHQVAVGHTTDGKTVTGGKQVLDHASVPDGVRLKDGTVLVYYVNGEDGATWVGKLEGETLTPMAALTVNGVKDPAGMVDPDATLLPSGSVRLAYFGSFGPPAEQKSRRASICLADSADGVHFTLVGEAIAFDEITTDPSLIQLTDGSWLMAVSQGEKTALARSKDGLRFEQSATLTYGGVPELARLPDGRVRIYVCARGIESYISGDQGATWTREGTALSGTPEKKLVCDPSFVAGTDLFIYKTAQ